MDIRNEELRSHPGSDDDVLMRESLMRILGVHNPNPERKLPKPAPWEKLVEQSEAITGENSRQRQLTDEQWKELVAKGEKLLCAFAETPGTLSYRKPSKLTKPDTDFKNNGWICLPIHVRKKYHEQARRVAMSIGLEYESGVDSDGFTETRSTRNDFIESGPGNPIPAEIEEDEPIVPSRLSPYSDVTVDDEAVEPMSPRAKAGKYEVIDLTLSSSPRASSGEVEDRQAVQSRGPKSFFDSLETEEQHLLHSLEPDADENSEYDPDRTETEVWGSEKSGPEEYKDEEAGTEEAGLEGAENQETYTEENYSEDITAYESYSGESFSEESDSGSTGQDNVFCDIRVLGHSRDQAAELFGHELAQAVNHKNNLPRSEYINGIYASMGTIMVLKTHRPIPFNGLHAAIKPKLDVSLRYWSDVALLHWKSVCSDIRSIVEPAVADPEFHERHPEYGHGRPDDIITDGLELVKILDYVVHVDIKMETITGAVVRTAWDSGVGSGVQPHIKKFTWNIEDEEGKALLGTTLGQDVAYLLLKHQVTLGRRKIVSVEVCRDTEELVTLVWNLEKDEEKTKPDSPSPEKATPPPKNESGALPVQGVETPEKASAEKDTPEKLSAEKDTPEKVSAEKDSGKDVEPTTPSNKQDELKSPEGSPKNEENRPWGRTPPYPMPHDPYGMRPPQAMFSPIQNFDLEDERSSEEEESPESPKQSPVRPLSTAQSQAGLRRMLNPTRYRNQVRNSGGAQQNAFGSRGLGSVPVGPQENSFASRGQGSSFPVGENPFGSRAQGSSFPGGENPFGPRGQGSSPVGGAQQNPFGSRGQGSSFPVGPQENAFRSPGQGQIPGATQENPWNPWAIRGPGQIPGATQESPWGSRGQRSLPAGTQENPFASPGQGPLPVYPQPNPFASRAQVPFPGYPQQNPLGSRAQGPFLVYPQQNPRGSRAQGPSPVYPQQNSFVAGARDDIPGATKENPVELD